MCSLIKTCNVKIYVRSHWKQIKEILKQVSKAALCKRTSKGKSRADNKSTQSLKLLVKVDPGSLEAFLPLLFSYFILLS